MSCERCQGMMVEDHLMDIEESAGLMWVIVWRCVNCGHAIDPVMVANRQLRKTAAALEYLPCAPEEEGNQMMPFAA